MRTHAITRRSACLGSVLAVIGACAGAPTSPAARDAPRPANPSATTANDPADAARAVTIGVRETVHSDALGEERGLLVYTPAGYEHSDAPYPVLYLLDGDAHFHHVTGVVAFLANIGRIPPMIVVGVSNTDRGRDFTPSHEERIPTSGGADAFVRFLEHELIPHIDARYRTRPLRVLIGHSLGGLLAVHILMRAPRLFHGYVAISPALQWDDRLVVRAAQAAWSADARLDKFLYFTVGAEPEDITQANQALAALLGEHAPQGLVWSFDHMLEDDHGSTPHLTAYRGLEALFADWRLPDDLSSAAAIISHYEAVSRRFGMPVKPAENPLNLRGYRLMGQNRLDQAIQILELNVALYPESANVYDSLGEALERAGQRERALENYEQAARRAALVAHPFLETFVANRDRLRDELAGASDKGQE